MSARNLSFVENGRSRPTREVVIALAGALDVPVRERNVLLNAAGFAPAYPGSPLDGEELRYLSQAIDHVLAQQEPYGAMVVDSTWNVVRSNEAARRLFTCFPPTAAEGIVALQNIALATVHPSALRPYVVNWTEVAGHLVARLHREVAARPAGDALARLLTSVLAQPDVPGHWRTPVPGRGAAPFLIVHLRSAVAEVKLFTILTSIGTPLDVTAEELRIESYFPADDATKAVLRAL